MAHRSGLRRTLTHEQLVSIPMEKEHRTLDVQLLFICIYLREFCFCFLRLPLLRFFLYFHRGPALFCLNYHRTVGFSHRVVVFFCSVCIRMLKLLHAVDDDDRLSLSLSAYH